MDVVRQNSIVTIKYSGKIDGNHEILTSTKNGPMTFRLNEFKLIRGLSRELLGMKVGEKKSCKFLPLDAFGEYDNNLVNKIPISELPGNIVKGMKLADNQNDIIWTIVDINQREHFATLDGNHNLAGHSLDFEIELITIKD